MPDAMEIVFQSALALGRHGAVSINLIKTHAGLKSFDNGIVRTLLFFLFVHLFYGARLMS